MDKTITKQLTIEALKQLRQKKRAETLGLINKGFETIESFESAYLIFSALKNDINLIEAELLDLGCDINKKNQYTTDDIPF
jgi:hypothetical protein